MSTDSISSADLKKGLLKSRESQLTHSSSQELLNDDPLKIYQLPSGSSVAKAVLKKLYTAAFVAFLFLLVEMLGGILSGSLAILSDAAHMFSDLSGFFISIVSVSIGTRPASKGLSFGYHRSEVIGAMGTIMIVWCLSLFLIFSATQRVIEREAVEKPLYMLLTACFGLLTNFFIAKILHRAPDSISSHGHSHEHHHHHSHSHSQSCNHEHKTNLVQKAIKDHNHCESDCKDEQYNKNNNIQEKNESLQHIESINNSKSQSLETPTTENQDITSISIPKQEDQIKKNFSHMEVSISKSEGIKSNNLSSIEAKDNYNLRAAMIHVVGDIIQSVGIVIASLVIFIFGGDGEYNNWHLADPICTYFFSLVVFLTTIPVCRECIRVLMEGSPFELDLLIFERQLKSVNSVVEIHDLHVWSLSKGKPAMMCHVFTDGNDIRQVLRDCTVICRKNGIYHSTIQIEEWSQKNEPDYIRCLHNIHS